MTVTAEQMARVNSIEHLTEGLGLNQYLTPEPFIDADLGVGVGLDEGAERSTWTVFPESAWTGLFARWRDVAAPVTEAPVEHLWFGVFAGERIDHR